NINIEPGRITNPDSNVMKSSMLYISNGKITAVPIIEINTIIPSPVDNVKILYLKILNSKIGCSNLSWRVINRNNESAPTTRDMPTWTLNQPESPAILNPYNKPPKPNVDKMIDNISTFGIVCFVIFFSKKYAATILISAIGSTT